MKRISRHELHKNMLDLYSQRSTCLRAQVAAIAVMDNRVIATGYNGALASQVHCDCNTELPCTKAIHAEANLIYFAAKHGISLNGAELFCNYSPCDKCSQAIIQSGFIKLYFTTEYRATDFYQLRSSGIQVFKWDESYKIYKHHYGAKV